VYDFYDDHKHKLCKMLNGFNHYRLNDDDVEIQFHHKIMMK